jgi:hypothetical protein
MSGAVIAEAADREHRLGEQLEPLARRDPLGEVAREVVVAADARTHTLSSELAEDAPDDDAARRGQQLDAEVGVGDAHAVERDACVGDIGERALEVGGALLRERPA